jgi:hypothetical protein
VALADADTDTDTDVPVRCQLSSLQKLLPLKDSMLDAGGDVVVGTARCCPS